MASLSVIVPAYNEASTIESVLEAVRAQTVAGVTFQVVVVDDGSTDGTREILGRRADLYDALVVHERNRGKGSAVRSGLERATGEWVLFQDADLEYDPAEYATLLQPVLRFDADVVMGSRFLAPRVTRVAYFWHKVGNRLITLAFNVLNNVTFSDIYSCYLLYRRNLLDPAELLTDGWEQQAEILSKVVARGRRLYEVPVSYHGRGYEEGKKIRAHHVVPVIWTILKGRFTRRLKPSGDRT